MSPPRAALAFIAFPAVLALTVAASDALYARHVEPGVIATLSFLLALALTVALERTLPLAASRVDPEDAVWFAVTGGAQGVWQLGFRALERAVAPTLVAWGRPEWSASAGPLAAQVALSLTLSELLKYSLHRWAHERAGLWSFHAEHHVPSRVYAINGARMHPVNLVWNLASDALVPLALGIDLRAVVLLAAVRNAVAAMQHASAAMRLDGWNYLFSTPDLHRWHHAADGRSSRVNYGSTLIVWDLAFGTRALPAGAPARYGLSEGSQHPRGLRAQLLWPWRAAARALRPPS